MAFLDLTVGSADRQLLPASVLKDEELPAIVAECEAVVLGAYTKVVRGSAPVPSGAAWLPLIEAGAYLVDAASGTYVCLRGYDPDPLQCEARLRAALKHEIAACVRWRRSQWRQNPLTAGESDGEGGKSVTFRADKNQVTPPGFGAHLLPFDLRPPAAVV